MFASILGALVPVFGLIAIGYLCGRIDLLGPRAFEVLNRLVIAVTLPVLTFRTLAHMSPADLSVPAMVAAVLGGAFAIYALGFLIERLAGRDLAEANIAGLAACFSNTGFVGLPVAMLAFGPSSIGPVAIAMALYAAVVFGVGVVISELAREPDGGLAAGLRRAGRAMVRSPLIMLSALGVVWAWAGLPLSGPADTLAATLAGATAPCALIAIGLFIAMPRESAAPAPIARVVLLKLVGHPLATAGLLLLLPPMPPMWGTMAILMAAMPSGASSFVLAGGAGRWAMELSAWAVMLTTVMAALTLIPVLWLLG
jgi:malonate transporter